MGTCVERDARFTMLLHLSRMDEREGAPRKNGPPLAGHGADAVRSTIASSMMALPGVSGILSVRRVDEVIDRS